MYYKYSQDAMYIDIRVQIQKMTGQNLYLGMCAVLSRVSKRILASQDS